LTLAGTPEPPYYAVIFTSRRAAGEEAQYEIMAERMARLAREQPGYLGHESAREETGITVSYWCDLDSIAAWKRQLDHLDAQSQGRARWYEAYRVRIARVERAYGFDREAVTPHG
jgi:heme-degrading monooxygenase HmoA